MFVSARNWKDVKYSRSAREARQRMKLANTDTHQSRITDFVFIRNEICSVQHIPEVQRAVSLSTLPEYIKQNFGHFLNVLLEHAMKNIGRTKNGNRYGSKLKLFAAYLYIYGGRSLYMDIAKNLKRSLPSLRTVNRTVSAHMDYKEDDLRIEELSIYLDLKKYPNKVWIEEDQTRIKGRIEYWSKTNQVVGFVLPITENGLPAKNCFLATSASTIKDFILNNAMSTYVNVLVAQPMQDGAYPFCIASYGTINRFDTRQVLNRWDHIHATCSSYGITVEGYSGDADSKILRAMKIRTLEENIDNDLPWFFVSSTFKKNLLVILLFFCFQTISLTIFILFRAIYNQNVSSFKILLMWEQNCGRGS